MWVSREETKESNWPSKLSSANTANRERGQPACLHGKCSGPYLKPRQALSLFILQSFFSQTICRRPSKVTSLSATIWPRSLHLLVQNEDRFTYPTGPHISRECLWFFHVWLVILKPTLTLITQKNCLTKWTSFSLSCTLIIWGMPLLLLSTILVSAETKDQTALMQI